MKTLTCLATIVQVVAIFTILLGLSTSTGATHTRKNKRSQGKGHVTRYACEGKTLELTCPVGQMIDVVRANYGRFSLNICNDDGHDWADTQCMNLDALNVMVSRCGGKRHCNVEASNDVFSDACPDTFKYLEVQFECLPDPTTTLPITTSTTKVPTTKTEKKTDTPQSTKTPYVPKVETTATKAPVVTIKTKKPVKPVKPIETTVKPLTTPTKAIFCPEVKERKIVWPRTEVGHPGRRTCPNNNDEYADWYCTKDGEWDEKGPNLSRCVSRWAEFLPNKTARINHPRSAIALAQEIGREISTQTLYGGDTLTTTQALATLVHKAKQTSEPGSKADRNAFADEMSQIVVDAGSNLLQERNRDAWLDLPSHVAVRSASNLLSSIEQNAIFIRDTMVEEDPTVTKPSINIFLEITGNYQIQEQYTQFPSVSLYDKSVDSIQIPKEAFPENQGNAKVIFASFNHLGEYMVPKPVLRGGNGKQVEMGRRVVSRIITAITPTPVRNLKEPVILTMATHQEKNMTSPSCVFWDKSAGNGVGDWSTSGCAVRDNNDTHTTCQCNHLTNFAVLMDLYGLPPDYDHIIALSILTYTGCLISIVCLAASIFAFLIMMIRSSSDRLTIHLNLCICLLIAEVVFIFGIPQVGDKLICGGIAGLLHYFFLAAFSWMLLEGFQLYAMLVEVFESSSSRKKWFYLFGYGFPLVIVGISLGIDYNSYGTSTHCWLRADNFFIMSFVGPVIVVLLFNTAFLVMALVIMWRHANLAAGYRHCQHRSTPENIGLWLRGAGCLVVLLGLTWTFGLMYVSKETIFFNYLFTICNASQGLFIFIFHVLFNDKARKEYRKWLRRNDWLPDCIRGPSLDYYYKPSSGGIGKYPTSTSSQTASSPLPMSESNSTANQSYPSKYLNMNPLDQPRCCNSSGQLLLKYNGYADQGRYDYAYANYMTSDIGHPQNHLSLNDVRKSSQHSPTSSKDRYFKNPDEYLKLRLQSRNTLPPVPNFPPPAPPYYYQHMEGDNGHIRNDALVPCSGPDPKGNVNSGYELSLGRSGLGKKLSNRSVELDDSAYSASVGSSFRSAQYPNMPVKVQQVSPSSGKDSGSRCGSGASSSSADFIIRDISSSPESSLHCNTLPLSHNPSHHHYQAPQFQAPQPSSRPVPLYQQRTLLAGGPLTEEEELDQFQPTPLSTPPSPRLILFVSPDGGIIGRGMEPQQPPVFPNLTTQL